MIYSFIGLVKFLPKQIVKLIHLFAFPEKIKENICVSKNINDACFMLEYKPSIALLALIKGKVPAEKLEYFFTKFLNFEFSDVDQYYILDLSEDFAIRAYLKSMTLGRIAYCYLRKMIKLDYPKLINYIGYEQINSGDLLLLIKYAVIYDKYWMLEYIKLNYKINKKVDYATLQSINYWKFNRGNVIRNATMTGNIELLKYLDEEPDFDFDDVLFPVFDNDVEKSENLAKIKMRDLMFVFKMDEDLYYEPFLIPDVIFHSKNSYSKK